MLDTCYECGKKVSDRASRCPHCGYHYQGKAINGVSSYSDDVYFPGWMKMLYVIAGIGVIFIGINDGEMAFVIALFVAMFFCWLVFFVCNVVRLIFK